MRKHYKRLIAGLLAAATIVPASGGLSVPQQAFADEILGETSFDYKMLPWHTVESAPAKQYFELSEGTVHITIIEPEGAEKEKWDLQFRHRNLEFKAGHEYRVSFKAKSKRDGMELCSKIGNIRGDEEYFELDGASNDMHMGPDMDGQWPSSAVKLSNEWQVFEGIFKPTRDLEAAEWSFQYAKGTMYQGNAQSGDELWFDDMSIWDMTDNDTPPPSALYSYTTRSKSGLDNNFISVNQLGYYQGLSKTATLGDNKGDSTYGAKYIDLEGKHDYEIVKASDDTVVYTGKTGSAIKDGDSGDTVCKIDFTDFNDEGEYYIRIKDQKWRSFPFRIGSDIYMEQGHDLLTNALNFFYQNRSGAKIEEKYITSGEKSMLAHDSNKDESAGYIQTEWRNMNSDSVDDVIKSASSKIDTSGGWFDGENFDKSMTAGGISLWTLQNMYERDKSSKEGSEKFADGSGTLTVPENGNKYPDILDECRYELDFMSKMKVKPDEKTWGDYAGMYYHRAHGIGFNAVQLDYEHEHHAVYSVEPPTFAATLNYAACAAQGARLWAQYDSEYAKELLTSAKEAYEAYRHNWYEADPNKENNNSTSLYAHDYQVLRTNYYDGDTEVLDDAYWAACELYISAALMEDKDAEQYLTYLSDYKNAFKFPTRIFGGSNADGKGSFTLFNSGNTASAGSLSLLLHSDLLTEKQSDTLKQSLLSAADEFIKAGEDQGYGIPYTYSDTAYVDPSGLLFFKTVRGFELASNERAINNMLAMAYAYDLTDDAKYINGVANGMNYLFGNNPLAFSYITGYGDYHAENPTHRYWRHELDKTLPKAPDGVCVSGPQTWTQDNYMGALGYDIYNEKYYSESFYADSVESWTTNAASLSCNASLAWLVSFMQDEAPVADTKPVLEGDLNNDGEFNVSDVVLLQKWLLADPDTKIENWKAANFCKDDCLDVFDLCLMKRKLIEG